MRLIALAALALCSFAASAQALKPGLWEINTRMQGAAGGQMAQAQAQMQEQLKNMPPDQRKMVEEMMAKQGMRPGAAGGGMNMQMCMTKEMAERSEVPVNRGDCQVTNQQRSSGAMKASFSCTNPPSSGEVQVTFSGPEAYSSKVMVKTVVDGKPETMNMESSGKWLATDCGSVKPPMMPKK